jgi:hypothetical protein
MPRLIFMASLYRVLNFGSNGVKVVFNRVSMRRISIFAGVSSLAAFACAAYLFAAARNPPLLLEGRSIGDHVSLRSPNYGCENLDDAATVAELVGKKDVFGGVRTAIHLRCRHFNAGPIGVIKSSSGSGGLVCVRPDSGNSCFWLARVWLH